MDTAIESLLDTKTATPNKADRREVSRSKASAPPVGVKKIRHESDLVRGNQSADPVKLFAGLPAIGIELAKRIVNQLNIDTIDSLYKAAYDGRLARIRGIGLKRITQIQAALNPKIQQRKKQDRQHQRHGAQCKGNPSTEHPSVAELLSVDDEYRKKADAGLLNLIAPKYANPQRIAWLPVLHTRRGDWHITSLFSNTDRAHVLRKTRDWVVLHCHTSQHHSHFTVVTETRGPLRGKRVIRGLSQECLDFYRLATK